MNSNFLFRLEALRTLDEQNVVAGLKNMICFDISRRQMQIAQGINQYNIFDSKTKALAFRKQCKR